MRRHTIAIVLFVSLVCAACLWTWRLTSYGEVNTGRHPNNNEVDTIVLNSPRIPTLFIYDGWKKTAPRLDRLLTTIRPTGPWTPGYILHALRLWGPVAKGSPLGKSSLSTEEPDALLSYFVSEKTFRMRVPVSNPEPYFFKSEYGLGERLLDDQQSANHKDDFLQLAAELGLDSAYAFDWAGKDYSMRDIFRHSIMWFNTGQEIDFTAVAYASYIKNGAKWTNRLGVQCSLDELCSIVLDRSLMKSSCYGTHQVYALAYLWNLSQEKGLISDEIRAKIEAKLREYTTNLEKMQEPSGAWNSTWFGNENSRSAKDTKLVERIRVTGHHLEWMALVPKELRPADQCVDRALSYLYLTLMEIGGAEMINEHLFSPCSHALRALLNLQGYRYASEYK